MRGCWWILALEKPDFQAEKRVCWNDSLCSGDDHNFHLESIESQGLLSLFILVAKCTIHQENGSRGRNMEIFKIAGLRKDGHVVCDAATAKAEFGKAYHLAWPSDAFGLDFTKLIPPSYWRRPHHIASPRR